MNLKETTLSSRCGFCGRLLKLRVDEVRLPDGSTAGREVIDHPGGVGVLALTDSGEALLVRQYRYPYAEVVTEIPAGKREPGEDPAATGLRELEEETGMTAEHMQPLGYLYPTPGYTNEITWLYLATGLRPTAAHPDKDEFLDVVRLPLEELTRQVLAGELPDAKTQIAVLKAALLPR